MQAAAMEIVARAPSPVPQNAWAGSLVLSASDHPRLAAGGLALRDELFAQFRVGHQHGHDGSSVHGQSYTRRAAAHANARDGASRALGPPLSAPISLSPAPRPGR